MLSDFKIILEYFQKELVAPSLDQKEILFSLAQLEQQLQSHLPFSNSTNNSSISSFSTFSSFLSLSSFWDLNPGPLWSQSEMLTIWPIFPTDIFLKF